MTICDACGAVFRFGRWCSCAPRPWDPPSTPRTPSAPSLHDLVSAHRVEHHDVLAALAAWARAEGRRVDLDLAALILALVLDLTNEGEFLDRPTVEELVFVLRDDGVLGSSVPLPDNVPAVLLHVLTFLVITGRVPKCTVPAEVLVEPARCRGDLDGDGRLRTAGSQRIVCQCAVPYDASLPLGVERHFVGWGKSRRLLSAEGIVLGPAADPPVSRLQPLHEFTARLRADGSPWEVWTEELHYAGEVQPATGAPQLSAYRLKSARRCATIPLLIDRAGLPWGARRDGRRKLGYRWIIINDTNALHRSGIVEHIQARPAPRAWWDEPSDAP